MLVKTFGTNNEYTFVMSSSGPEKGMPFFVVNKRHAKVFEKYMHSKMQGRKVALKRLSSKSKGNALYELRSS